MSLDGISSVQRITIKKPEKETKTTDKIKSAIDFIKMAM